MSAGALSECRCIELRRLGSLPFINPIPMPLASPEEMGLWPTFAASNDSILSAMVLYLISKNIYKEPSLLHEAIEPFFTAPKRFQALEESEFV